MTKESDNNSDDILPVEARAGVSLFTMLLFLLSCLCQLEQNIPHYMAPIPRSPPDSTFIEYILDAPSSGERALCDLAESCFKYESHTE